MHAVANVVTVALPPLPHPSVTATAEPTEETFEAWLADTNAKLPPDVRVLARSRAPPQFNADTACERRRFEYLVKYSVLLLPLLGIKLDPWLPSRVSGDTTLCTSIDLKPALWISYYLIGTVRRTGDG